MGKPKIYEGSRDPGGQASIEVKTIKNGQLHGAQLKIVRVFSPTHFDWGTVGGCSLETAYSILVDYLGNETEAARYAHAFRDDIISRLPNVRWTFNDHFIDECLSRYNPYYGIEPAAVWDFPVVETGPSDRYGSGTPEHTESELTGAPA